MGGAGQAVARLSGTWCCHALMANEYLINENCSSMY